ncbi:MAG: hypothetical protein GF418_10590 [Chitinivibrionales bacterium]|nr:hypothetical protein [Chitinivibrionales bacterium]MBD3396061.1 hypothetical protein [Chitinivibrionales bacterium]
MGVIALSVVMAVAGLGYLQVAASVAKNELRAFEEDQALLASESGALLAARWLRSQEDFPQNGTFTPLGSPFENQINGMDVYVTLVASTDANGATTVSITSEAYKDPSGAQTKDESTFMKRVAYSSLPMTFGRYSTVIGRTNPGWPGFGLKRFYGDTYIGHTLRLAVTDNDFYGDVFTPDNTEYEAGCIGANDYSRGVELKDENWAADPVARAAEADNVFHGSYSSGVPEIDFPASSLTDSLVDGAGFASVREELPKSFVDEGKRYNHCRPTLKFEADGSAKYYYYDSDYSVEVVEYGSVDGKMFVSKENNINVVGTVKGNATVSTDVGLHIAVVGDLTYEDYDPATGIPADSDNMLGLVSGGDMVFPNKWKKYRFSAPEVITGDDGQLDLTASMLTLHEGSCEWFDIYREGRNNTAFRAASEYSYELNFTGNHVLELWRPNVVWRNPFSDWVKGMENSNYRFDDRFASGKQPIGFPSLKDSDGSWLVTLSGWTEEDTY